MPLNSKHCYIHSMFDLFETVGNWTGANEQKGVNKNEQWIIVEYDANTDSSYWFNRT